MDIDVDGEDECLEGQSSGGVGGGGGRRRDSTDTTAGLSPVTAGTLTPSHHHTITHTHWDSLGLTGTGSNQQQSPTHSQSAPVISDR